MPSADRKTVAPRTLTTLVTTTASGSLNISLTNRLPNTQDGARPTYVAARALRKQRRAGVSGQQVSRRLADTSRARDAVSQVGSGARGHKPRSNDGSSLRHNDAGRRTGRSRRCGAPVTPLALTQFFVGGGAEAAKRLRYRLQDAHPVTPRGTLVRAHRRSIRRGALQACCSAREQWWSGGSASHRER